MSIGLFARKEGGRLFANFVSYYIQFKLALKFEVRVLFTFSIIIILMH